MIFDVASRGGGSPLTQASQQALGESCLNYSNKSITFFPHSLDFIN